MCNCSSKKVGTSPAGCGDITIALLEEKLAKFNCVKDNNYYSLVSLSPDYVQSKIDLLTLAIIDKQSHSTSCKYSNSLIQINIDISNIVQNTDC